MFELQYTKQDQIWSIVLDDRPVNGYYFIVAVHNNNSFPKKTTNKFTTTHTEFDLLTDYLRNKSALVLPQIVDSLLGHDNFYWAWKALLKL